MKKQTLSIELDICAEYELTPKELMLINAAKKACETSYAPYSHFHVGAAARLDGGTIVTGSNQENASFTVGTCAERCTIYAAHAQQPLQKIQMLAIAACDENGIFLSLPITPCGACRQALLETEQKQDENILILLYGTKEIYRISRAADLLPLHFDSEAMSNS